MAEPVLGNLITGDDKINRMYLHTSASRAIVFREIDHKVKLTRKSERSGGGPTNASSCDAGPLRCGRIGRNLLCHCLLRFRRAAVFIVLTSSHYC